jgi:3-deoxy-D-manno-octulosonate 8-phosphate phosphatase (KDO 8-P phosphatase)
MSLVEKCRNIRLLITDVDGVLTDGQIIYHSDGTESKAFNVKDGFICSFLTAKGIRLAILTGRSSEAVKRRGEELGFSFVIQGKHDKLESFHQMLKESGLTAEQAAYIGDDLNDLDVMNEVGLSAAPADAIESIRKSVDYICQNKGGSGAFREFADLILKHQL